MMELRAKNRNFIMQLQNDQIDFQPKFCVAMDSMSSKQLQNNELVFLDGIFDREKQNDDAAAAAANNDETETSCFFEGEEVDLNATDGIVHMRLATDIDDIDEPYKDSDGRLYYVCEKCAFICVDRATLLKHSSEIHRPKLHHQHQRRQRNNNSALRLSDDQNHLDDFLNNETNLSQEQAATPNTSASPPPPPPLQPEPVP